VFVDALVNLNQSKNVSDNHHDLGKCLVAW